MCLRNNLRLLVVTSLLCTYRIVAGWSPSFSLNVESFDGDHPESSVPDVCDAAKRPVQFYYNVPRHCFDLNRRLDIVIAYSVEKSTDLIETVNLLRSVPKFKLAVPCVVVGSKVDNASAVLDIPGVDIAFEVGRAGREWAVYLAYLISYYDNLPEHVVFMHARLNLPPEDLMPKFAMYGPHTGIMGVVHNGKCHCHGCSLPAPVPRLRELWSIFRRSFCPQSYLAMFNGHYIVSKRRIQDNPVDLYKVLYRYVMHHPRHFLAADAHEQMSGDPKFYIDFVKNLDACEDTLGGHVMERAWSFVFNCWNGPDREACQPALQPDAIVTADSPLLDPTCAYSGWQCYDAAPPYPLNTTHFLDGRPYAIQRTRRQRQTTEGEERQLLLPRAGVQQLAATTSN